jgi:outer membrane immunogenic protein
LGYAAHNNLLIYATGGLAYGEVEYRYALNFPSIADYARASDSKTKAGWTVGGGGEYSFGRWSLKGEYLYYDLGEESLRAQAVEGPGGSGGPVDIFLTPEFETKGHIVRVGLNFKLGHRSRQAVPLK